MIYEMVSPDEPIQQGDLFRRIPKPEFSLSELAVVSADEQAATKKWSDLFNESDEAVAAIVGIQPVYAIVITQNCDNARGKDVCFCLVDRFAVLLNRPDLPKNPKSWQRLIIKIARTNPRFFYLPEDASIGFSERMAADFRTVLRVPRDDVLAMRENYRIGRLVSVATDHFRESLGNFFRRYAYNEWYPLNKVEAEEYATAQRLERDALYDWQR